MPILLRASWKIHPEYYLYHDKFLLMSRVQNLVMLTFQRGKLKTMNFFCKIRVHTGEFSVDIPLTNIESSQVSFI
ncbi:hypothetical protein BSPWISOXPB_11328, partial [uncultured Gammaproteobacteria bacterium]